MSAILAHEGPDKGDPGLQWECMGVANPRMVPRAGGGGGLSNVLVLTGGPEPPAEILPSLTLLPHAVRVAAAAAASLGGSPLPDAVLVDARRDLVQAKRLVQALRE